ncbi:MAG: molybdate ABC transporter substrate-binding protein [Alphaproteobacteria bacterium]
MRSIPAVLVRSVGAALAVALLSLSVVPAPAHADEALVVVATNFKEVAGELKTMFEAETEHTVNITTGSTGKLYAQIKNGAPFHVFMAADRERPKRLEDEGDGVPGTRLTYAIGRIVLWSPDAGRISGNGVEALKAGDFDHLAIANPELAPYGLAAKQTLRYYGLWDTVSARIVMGQNIGQAHSMVATGNAQMGFVAKSHVASPGNRQPGSSWDVPGEAYDPIRQDAVLLKAGAENAAARAFLDFLRSPWAREVIGRFGYGVEQP